MPETWLVALLVVLTVSLFVLRRSVAREVAVAFADEREERLTHALARQVGCALAQALPAVRKELDLGPGQSDETILKRAAYHYRRDQPDAGPCHVFRDRRG